MTDRSSRLWIHAGWHVLVLIVLLFVPGYVAFRDALWELPGQNGLMVPGLAGVYLLAAAVSLWVRRRGSVLDRLAAVLSAASAGLAVLFFGIMLLPDATYSRLILLQGAVLVTGGLVLPCLPPKLWKYTVISVLAASVLVAGIVALDISLGGKVSGALGAESIVRRISGGPAEDRPRRRSEVIRTSRHTLQATFYSNHLPDPDQPKVSGGAIARDPTGNGYVLARARGDLHRFVWDDEGALELHPLDRRVPVNNAEFEADVGEDVPRQWFRVADILVRRDSGGVRLFASHHFWKRDEQCFVVRISSTLMPANEADASAGGGTWHTVFESSPCLPIKFGSRGVPFAGLQIGGNMAFLDPRTLLLTLGDHQFDGWYGEPDLVRDSTAHYGKTVTIDLASGRAEIFTLGHRNPQGLTIDEGGRIWATEHGPEGGDELNLLRRGGDYGWPFRTYGTDYGGVTWPLGDSAENGDFQSPVYAWVPSIGISEVVSVDDSIFRAWKGNLLVASLRGQQLWRVELDGDRVALTEPIEVGERIRDVAAPADGSIVLWTDLESLVRLEPARALDRGATLFALRCGGCHETGPEMNHGIGPNLRGVFERPVASADGFDYSNVLASLEGRWTDARMGAYIANPDSFAPGTTMSFEGVADSAARASLIRYLETLE